MSYPVIEENYKCRFRFANFKNKFKKISKSETKSKIFVCMQINYLLSYYRRTGTMFLNFVFY